MGAKDNVRGSRSTSGYTEADRAALRKRACDNFLRCVVDGVRGVMKEADDMIAAQDKTQGFASWIEATRDDVSDDPIAALNACYAYFEALMRGQPDGVLITDNGQVVESDTLDRLYEDAMNKTARALSKPALL